MTQFSGEPLKLTKNELLNDNPIFMHTLLCETVYEPQVSFSELYTHDIIEIGLVTAGNGVHRILNQALPCKQGDIFIVRSHIPHGYFSSSASRPLKVRRLMFDVKDWFSKEIADSNSPRFCYGLFLEDSAIAYAMLNKQTHSEIQRLFNMLETEAAEEKTEWQDNVRANLTLLLIILGRYVNGAIKNIPATPSKEWRVVSSALRIITESFNDTTLTLETVAAKIFISKSHLSRLFKKITGEFFSDYLKSVRIEHACRLLRETDTTVEKVVALCGLKDVPSFYKTFCAQTGKTPHQYRTVHKKNKAVNISNQKGEKIMSIFNEMSENLQRGKGKIVAELVQQALDEGCSPIDILNEGLLSGMSIVGEKFKNNQVFVPEVLIAARAMNMGTQILKPHLVTAGVQSAGKVALGTVQGDLHDIGKNLVRMMMEGKGLEVVDLGTDVPAEKFVQTAIQENCNIIACSALLTTTMGVMGDVVKAAEAAGVRDKIKIMIGGAPVTDDFCQSIGADCYTPDAASAADMALAYCKQ